MTEEEKQQQVELQRAWARELSKAEDRAVLWKCVAITVFLMLLWCVLDMHGCIPSGGGWPDMT